LIPNPIVKVLSTLTSRGVRFLLMGGQACVLYGATEFSRDTDIAILPDAANLSALASALADLKAEDMRLDVMSVMRGVAPFEDLWARRTSITVEGFGSVEVLGLPDLIKAEKKQRDKDWPMIRRLVESHFQAHQATPTEDQVRFWLCEARTPAILQTLAASFPALAAQGASERPLLRDAVGASVEALEDALRDEERSEREADRRYWAPLKSELERLRHQKNAKP
jgi:hypothetical protein